jgi:hypothetical protein
LHIPAILALRRQKQYDHEFEASLGFIGDPVSKKNSIFFLHMQEHLNIQLKTYQCFSIRKMKYLGISLTKYVQDY